MQLGRMVEQPANPSTAILEAVPNEMATTKYLVRLTCPEFTSLCPVTGQPDFAQFVIDYVPNEFLIESKSLKLFMASFRNHAAFHETTTIYISERLMVASNPVWMRINAFWYPRGGIPIDVFWQSGNLHSLGLNVHVPVLDMRTYRGR